MLTFSINKEADFETIYRLAEVGIPKKSWSENGKEWVGQVWLRALSGKLKNPPTDERSIEVFGRECNLHQRVLDNKRQVAILDEDEVEYGFSGVVGSTLVAVDDDFNESTDRLNSKFIIEEFCHVNERLIIEEGINLHKLIKLALKNEKFGAVLREVVEELSLHDLVREVLTNKYCLKALFQS